MDNSNSESNKLISVKNLSKSFSSGLIEILNNVDFDITVGESLSIIGASGIGKSTLLHLLGTLDRPDSGSLFFHGENVFQFNDDKLARFRNESIGFVFQFHHLLPEFSALENVMMPVIIHGDKKENAMTSAEEILVRVGLKDRLSHRVGELSGGEQQRVALARAIVLKPSLLLADEPTGNLDKKNSQQIHELFLELNKEYAMAMVIVTHNMDLAEIMSRKVTIVEGKLAEI